MKKKEEEVFSRGEKLNDKYSLYDIFTIKKANIFWKWVDIFSCKMSRMANFYERVFSKQYTKEGKRFDLDNSHNILHIGCGSFPVTAITLSKLNGGKIVGVDKSPKAVKLAKQIINKRHLENRIKIDIGDGSTYPLNEFDTIIISSCSIPKIKILEHIFENANENSKIIVREQIGISRFVSDYVKMHDNIQLLNTMKNDPLSNNCKWESFYLVKK